ncbi:hypothetical protein FVE67_06165 [Thermosulfurimonas marina]|uniref:Class I SAM-dependent methyltransferase n=1 Tax=Thermosulfurimonas marina TaxID=2047767 RepID=A0A6H1WTB0_9BACT|nr:class I SAM-dependent methyltransferase [Thermosulfurimonas marina]QJA06410.1 hypothetical protein FVE67_06165 [Thermosulfurimonas marina]
MEWLFLFGLGAGVAALLLYALSVVLVLPKTRGAMFVGTSRRRIRAVLEALELSPTARVVDLGCGDGRFLRAVWRRFGVRALGYEINPLAWFLARGLNFLFRIPAEVRFGDFWEADLSDYDLIFCYLFPDLMSALSEKISREARPGTLVVSANFPLPGLKPQRVLQVGEPIYFYRL